MFRELLDDYWCVARAACDGLINLTSILCWLSARLVGAVRSLIKQNPSAENQNRSGNNQRVEPLAKTDKQLNMTGGGSTNSGRNKKRDCYDWITLTIAFLGLVGLWYYAYWAKVQGKATQDAADAAKQSADAAVNAAHAAVSQAHTADETMRITNRAYVTVGQPNGGVLADWQRDKSNKITGLIVHFQNAGNTPAFQLYVNLLPTPGQLPDTHFAHLPSSWVTGDVIGAHSTLDKPVLYFAGKHIDDVLAGSKTWKWSCKFDGDFEYTNIFGEYCCEPFSIYLEDGRWWSGGGVAHGFVCPNWPNVCAGTSKNPEDEIAERFNQKAIYDAGTAGKPCSVADSTRRN